jgi:hypothetical protein
MSENTKKNQERPLIPWIKPSSGEVDEIYANLLTLQWTLDDVRMRFAQLVNDPNEPSPGKTFVPVGHERASVTLSWRNAKVLRDSLSELIANYESLNGEILSDVKLATPANAAKIL